MAAPWVLLPMVTLLIVRTPGVVRGIAVGLTTELAALVAFYAADSTVLQLGSGSWITHLRLTLTGGEIYLVRGLVVGPVVGAIGSVIIFRAPRMALALSGVVVGAEPLFLIDHRHFPNSVTHYLAIWVAQVVVGAMLLLASTPGRKARSLFGTTRLGVGAERGRLPQRK